jgi:hypothetical protein
MGASLVAHLVVVVGLVVYGIWPIERLDAKHAASPAAVMTALAQPPPLHREYVVVERSVCSWPRPVVSLPPAVARRLREAGIPPSESVRQAMIRDRRTRVSAKIDVCFDHLGQLDRASIARSSGYVDYDDALLSAFHRQGIDRDLFPRDR